MFQPAYILYSLLCALLSWISSDFTDTLLLLEHNNLLAFIMPVFKIMMSLLYPFQIERILFINYKTKNSGAANPIQGGCAG